MEAKKCATAGSSSSAKRISREKHCWTSRQCHPRRGFTLVEMLTVIIIISILAGLVVVAAVPAIRRAREFTIRQEIAQLELALEKYHQERGDYPPDFAGVDGGATGDNTGANSLAINSQAAVLRHFRRAFPRYRPGACGFLGTPGSYDALLYDISYATRSNPSDAATGIDVNNINLNPATAMVFMLGGPPASEGLSPRLLGFSANPANPFAIGGSRLPQLYEFDETRLCIHYHGDDDNDTPISLPTFIPPHMPQAVEGCQAPYVYFRPRNRDYRLTRSTGAWELPFFFDAQEQGICTPYADTVTNEINWMEPTKFQIICAGLDGLFREPLGHDPVEIADVEFDSSDLSNIRFLNIDDANIAPEEDDNITSFTQGKLADRAEE